MDPDNLKATLEAWKTAAEILALLMAGAAAVFGFVVFRRRETAIAQLRKVELENRRIELESREIALLNPEIEASVHSPPSREGFWVTAVVTLRNAGTRDTRLLWEGAAPAFAVRKVHFEDNGIPRFGVPIEVRARRTLDPNQEARSLVVRAGATERLTFAVQLGVQGLYLISFRALLDPLERTVSEAAGTTGASVVWSTTKYLVVSADAA